MSKIIKKVVDIDFKCVIIVENFELKEVIMFNKETVDFLKSINKISNGIVLSYPVTAGKTDSADIGFMFDLSKFDTDGFENPIGFIDFSSFLNIFSLFGNERNVEIKDNLISVSNSESSANYVTSAVSLLSQYEYKASQFDVLSNVPTVLEMTLTSEDIRKLKSASTSFKDLDTIVISSEENVELYLTQIGKFKHSSNSFKINKTEVANKNFTVGISLETLSKIPQIDYKLSVKFNEQRNAYRLLLESVDIEGFKLALSVKSFEE